MKALKTAGKQAGVAILAVMLAISMLTIMLPQTTYADTAPKQPVASINGQSGTNVSFVYSGKAKKVSWDSGSYENDPSISYTKKGDTTVTDEQPTDVGSYTLRLHFPSDPLGTVTYDAVTVTQDFTITQDTNTVSGLTMADFTYGNTPGKPSASSKYESGAITYTYYEDAACTVPVAISSTTAAGTYYVKATSKGTDNYKSDSATASFKILKKSAVSVPGTVTKDYTGAEITGLTNSDAYTVANAVHMDAGTYDITLTLKSGYTWEDGSTDPKTVKFTINKKKVAVPTVASKEYNGETQKADIADTAEYAVTTNDGGKDGGSYDVVLTLKDTNNHVWANGDTKTTTVKFTITRTENYWIEGLQIQSWRAGETAQEPTAKAKWGTVQYKYYDEDGSAVAKSEVSAAGTYYVEAYVEATDSLKAITSGKVKFQVYDKKTGVVLPTAADKAYTGEKQTSGLKATKDYTIVSDEGGTDVGTYTVTLRLNDPANFTWADGTSEDKEISWKITKAKNSWDTALSTADWTYGDKASSPAAEPHFGTVSEYKYYEKAGNSYTQISRPKNAGTYYVKAFVNGTDNYEALESGYVKFNIERQAVKVPTLKSKVYNAKAQTPDIDSELYGLYDYEAVTDAGTYTVKLKLKDSANYRWYGVPSGSIATTEFKITKGENEFTKALSIEGWAYGKTPNEPSAEAKWGKVEYHYYTNKACTNEIDIDQTTAAGTYYVKAVVPGNDNYAEISDTASFTISKAEVEVPTVASKEYNGEAQKADIRDTAKYTVTTNDGGTEGGSYDVVLTLKDAKNYIWSNGDTETTAIKFTITKAENYWIEGLQIQSWRSGETAQNPTASAKWGTVLYRFYSEDGSIISQPDGKLPGTYYVEAYVEGSDSYSALTSGKVKFQVYEKKAGIVLPTAADKAYTGEKQTSGLKATKDYTIVSDEGGTDVGTYTVTLRLSDPANFTWADGTSGDKEISWKITKAKNRWDTALSMADWTYGDEASTPAAKPHFGTVSEYNYYKKDSDSYTQISKPENAGTYYVKAFVDGTDNYEALESGYVKFNIERQAVKVPTLKSKVYNAKAQTPDIDSELYGLYDYEAVTDAGTYTVKLKLKDSANYRWYGVPSGSIATTEFKITKGENEFTKALSIEGWAYGKTPNEPSAEAKWGKVEYHYYTNKACTNEIDIDEETGAGTYYVKAVVPGSGNYDEISTSVSFKIAKAKVEIPTLKDLTYTGKAQKAGIPKSPYYNEVSSKNVEHVNVGTYTAYIELTETDNFTWADGTLTKQHELEYKIVQAKNEWTEELKVTNKDCDGDPAEVTAKAKFGDVEYTYYDSDLKKLDSAPTRPGKYFVEASVAETDNYTGLKSDKVSFRITKKTGIVLPTVADKAYTGEKQTSGLKATEDYIIVSDEGGTDIGTYTVTLRLNDPANCTWADGTNEDKKISWKITKAKNSWDTALSMADWTYGDEASTPAAKPHFGTVSEYNYYKKDSDSYTQISKPENAGTYYVKAFVDGTDNYEALESGYVKFNIERQAVKVPTLKSKVYNAKAQTPDIDSELYGLYDYEAVTDAGTYTVKLKLKDSANYRWYGVPSGSIATTEFKITKGENEFTKALSIEGWAYGKTPNEPSAEAKWGKVEYHYYTNKACTNEIDIDEETGAGTYYVKAVVPGSGNYDEISTSVSFKIAKAKVEIPTLKDLTYTGKAQKAGIPKSPYYNEVSSKNVEHVNVGTYTAYIELTETDNFTWADGTLTKQHELEYKIVQAKNEWTEELKVTNKDCDGDPAEVTAKAKFGDVEYTYYDSDLKKLDSAPTRPGKYFVEASVAETDNYTGLKSDKVSFRITQADNEWTGELKAESKDYDGDPAEVSAAAKYGTVTYKYYDTDMNELDQAPTKPGAYYVKAIVEETDNYKGLESKTVKFTIKKLVVDIPAYTKASKYNGKLQTAEIPESGLYEVVENKGGIDAGEYKVVLKLKDPSIYAWNDGDQDGDGTITLPYLITKDDNEWIKDLSIDNWTYGKTAKKPVAEAKYGDVVYTYYSSSKKQLSAAPTMPGTYYVKATVTGTEGFSKLASGYVQFKIYKPALVLKATPRTKTTENLKWTKLTKIDGYMVYYAKCGRDMKYYKTYSKSRTSMVKRDLKKGTAYKYRIKAYKVVNGKKVIVASAYVSHAIAGGYSKKHTDAKSVSVPDKYVNLSVGESYKIKVKVTKLKKSRNLLDYDHDMYVRFSSSDSSIAYVAADGTIKGKQAGTCRINATALNGMTAVVYVTVVK